MKSRGGLGREVRFPLSPLPLPRFYFFALLFTSQPSPLSERLGQAILKICQGIKFPCICVKFYFKLFTFQTHVHVTDVNHWLQGLHELMIWLSPMSCQTYTRLSRGTEFTPVPSHGSTFVCMIPPQNVKAARVTPAWIHAGCCTGIV